MADDLGGIRQRWQNADENMSNHSANEPVQDMSNSRDGRSVKMSDSDDGSNNYGQNKTCYKNASEYSQAVHNWLVQYHMWNQMNWLYMSIPFQVMQMNMMNQLSAPGLQTPQSIFFPNVANDHVAGQDNVQTIGSIAGTTQNPTNTNPLGQEYKIPSLWKRVAGEFIDFFLLFIVKLAVTIVFVEYIGLVDFQHYDLEYLMTADMDYNTAFAMTSELIAMEIVNRVFICFFETLCLRQGIAGSVGGTTPGKRMMGLKVISCREVRSAPNNKVLVTPAGNIGVWNAFVRSVIKNFSLAFFFPVCLTVYFFQHNRAAYDIISNCIVVECDELRRRRRR